MKRSLFAIPVILLLTACSSTLDSDEGKDLSNKVPSAEEKKTELEDFSLSLGDGIVPTQVPQEDSKVTDPQYPELVQIDDPTITVPLDQDTNNYYLFDDNFNNTSITVYTTDSYPGLEEIGTLKDTSTEDYLEGWLKHFKTTYESQAMTGKLEHGFLNWEDGTRGAYVSYEFAVEGIPEDTKPVEGMPESEGAVEMHPTFFTEFVLIKDDKVLSGTSTAEKIGFPEYLQSLEF